MDVSEILERERGGRRAHPVLHVDSAGAVHRAVVRHAWKGCAQVMVTLLDHPEYGNIAVSADSLHEDTLGPFLTGVRDGQPYGAVDVASRLNRVEEFGIDQCYHALGVPNLQKTVKTAIERRIRKIEKESQQ